MTAVIIYTIVIVFTTIYSGTKVLHAKRYGQHPLVTKANAGEFLLGFLIVLPLYIWVIATVGWAWPTILMAINSAVGMAMGFSEIDRYGGLVTTVRGSVIGIVVQAVIIYGLFSIVS